MNNLAIALDGAWKVLLAGLLLGAAQVRVDALLRKRILVGGHAGTRAPHLARVYDRNGRPQGAAFGDTTDDLNADDHFCHVHGAVLCSAGICVHDGNCRRMRVFDAQHAVSANVQISRAIGVEYPWVAGITVVRDGVAYATANQQRGRASERTNRLPIMLPTILARQTTFPPLLWPDGPIALRAVSYTHLTLPTNREV